MADTWACKQMQLASPSGTWYSSDLLKNNNIFVKRPLLQEIQKLSE